MVLEILCVEPIYTQYSGLLKTRLALRCWFFEVLGSESVKQQLPKLFFNLEISSSLHKRPKQTAQVQYIASPQDVSFKHPVHMPGA